jgi:hypothetical protein
MRPVFLSLVFLFTFGCAHMKSGQHVYWRSGVNLDKIARENRTTEAQLRELNPSARPGQWLFVPNKVGFLPFLDDTSVVEDYSELGKGNWAWPVPSHRKISSKFGDRWGRKHEGIDIPAPKGTPIVATAEGIVKYSDSKVRGYGNMIVLEHADKVFSVYAHNQKNLVRVGARVKRGQMIGRVGNTGRSTGPHLHFELRMQNKARDPARYLGQAP